MYGLFITFEGPDGGGKTTQLHLLKEALEQRNCEVVLTREPGGTLISDQIRRILLHPNSKHMRAETEVLLYAASRAQHVREKIYPALAAGKIVLCDRFVDASIAYQASGLGIEEEHVKQINAFATDGLTPDRTYLLDVPPEVGRQRLRLRSGGEFGAQLDRIESREADYHRKVRRAFLDLAHKEKRILLIDGTQAVHTIQNMILEDVEKILAPGK